MIPIRYIEGDATDPQGEGVKIIAHCCNDEGAWGAGFVLALSNRWSEPEWQYRRWRQIRSRSLPLGAVQFVDVEPGVVIANIIGQEGTGFRDGLPPIRYKAIGDGLAKVAAYALEQKASVHMPRIGCGLAGGDWDVVESLIVTHLSRKDVQVMVYDLPKR